MTLPHTRSIPLQLERKHKSYSACLVIAKEYPHLEDAHKLLHQKEVEYFDTSKSEKRKKSILLGKLVAKEALRNEFPEVDYLGIDIQKGVFEHPVIYTPFVHNTQVTISHSVHYGASIAFPEEHPMGVDIEAISKIKVKAIAGQCTKDEVDRLLKYTTSEKEAYALLWTTKESISKCIRTGLLVDFKQLEISSIEQFEEGYYVFHFKKFLQYKTYVIPHKEYCLAISLPKKSQLNIEYMISNLP